MTGETLLYLSKRFIASIITIFGVLTLVFIIIRTVPGDPARNILGETATEEDVKAFREKHNLDRPVYVQYLLYMSSILDGSLGYTYDAAENETTVSSLILKNFPFTLELAISSMVVALTIAVPLGLSAAYRRGRLVDRLTTTLSLIGAALPAFFLGPALIYIFACMLRVFPDPASGAYGLKGLILPSIALGAALSAKLTRMLRASVLEVLNSKFILQVRAKGVSELRVAVHVVKNSSIPVITIASLQFAALLTGAIVVEKVFSRQGLGTLLLDAITIRNYDLVQGCVLVIAVIYVVMNFLTDVFYAIVDPRIVSGSDIALR